MRRSSIQGLFKRKGKGKAEGKENLGAPPSVEEDAPKEEAKDEGGGEHAAEPQPEARRERRERMVGRHVFGCFDVNGKCGLKVWRDRLAALRRRDWRKLLHVAEHRGIRDPGSLELEVLIRKLMALEEIGELHFRAEPTYAQFSAAMLSTFGKPLTFSFHHKPSKGSEGSEVKVEGAQEFAKAVAHMHSIRRGEGPLAIAIELHPAKGEENMLYFDCFDAEADEDDIWMGEVKIEKGSLWPAMRAKLEEEFGDAMKDGCELYYVEALVPGQVWLKPGRTREVSVSGAGWAALAALCAREPDRRMEVDVRFSPHVATHTLGGLACGETTTHTLRWPNPLDRAVTYRISSDSEDLVRCLDGEASVEPAPELVRLHLEALAQEGPRAETVTIRLDPLRDPDASLGESDDGEPWFIRVRAEWV